MKEIGLTGIWISGRELIMMILCGRAQLKSLDKGLNPKCHLYMISRDAA